MQHRVTIKIDYLTMDILQKLKKKQQLTNAEMITKLILQEGRKLND